MDSQEILVRILEVVERIADKGDREYASNIPKVNNYTYIAIQNSYYPVMTPDYEFVSHEYKDMLHNWVFRKAYTEALSNKDGSNLEATDDATKPTNKGENK